MAYISFVGNLVGAPELRFTASGKAVANFTVAESHRVKQDGEWKDQGSTFWRCSVWDSAAENLVESLVKGQRVSVVGEAKARSFETKEGEKRTVVEVFASEVGASLKWATAKVEKSGGGNPPKPKPADDPWGNASAFGDDSEAPF